MSDQLSNLLQSVKTLNSTKKEDPNQRLINSLKKALKATTPEHPGSPWEIEEEENDKPKTGYWLREAD